MFGRTRGATSSPPPQPVNLGYHAEVDLVGNPDLANLTRRAALFDTIGRGVQGFGNAVGYDRGDPAHSLSAVLGGTRRPTAAIGSVGRIADAISMAPPAEFADQAGSNPNLDAYNALLWNRIAR